MLDQPPVGAPLLSFCGGGFAAAYLATGGAVLFFVLPFLGTEEGSEVGFAILMALQLGPPAAALGLGLVGSILSAAGSPKPQPLVRFVAEGAMALGVAGWLVCGAAGLGLWFTGAFAPQVYEDVEDGYALSTLMPGSVLLPASLARAHSLTADAGLSSELGCPWLVVEVRPAAGRDEAMWAEQLGGMMAAETAPTWTVQDHGRVATYRDEPTGGARRVDAFVAHGRAYGLIGRTCADTGPDALDTLFEGFRLLSTAQGEASPPDVAEVSDRTGRGWLLRDGMFRSTVWRFDLVPPPGWRVVVGNELRGWSMDDHVALERDDPHAIVLIEPSGRNPSSSEVLEAQLIDELRDARILGPELSGVPLLGEPARFSAFVEPSGRTYQRYQARTSRHGLEWEVWSRMPMSQGPDQATAALTEALGAITVPELDPWASDLELVRGARDDSVEAVGSVWRVGGTVVDFERGVLWTVGDPSWPIGLGIAATNTHDRLSAVAGRPNSNITAWLAIDADDPRTLRDAHDAWIQDFASNVAEDPDNEVEESGTGGTVQTVFESSAGDWHVAALTLQLPEGTAHVIASGPGDVSQQVDIVVAGLGRVPNGLVARRSSRSGVTDAVYGFEAPRPDVGFELDLTETGEEPGEAVFWRSADTTVEISQFSAQPAAPLSNARKQVFLHAHRELPRPSVHQVGTVDLDGLEAFAEVLTAQPELFGVWHAWYVYRENYVIAVIVRQDTNDPERALELAQSAIRWRVPLAPPPVESKPNGGAGRPGGRRRSRGR